jgi:hypothetical protein
MQWTNESRDEYLLWQKVNFDERKKREMKKAYAEPIREELTLRCYCLNKNEINFPLGVFKVENPEIIEFSITYLRLGTSKYEDDFKDDGCVAQWQIVKVNNNIVNTLPITSLNRPLPDCNNDDKVWYYSLPKEFKFMDVEAEKFGKTWDRVFRGDF